MSAVPEYCSNKASEAEIAEHLARCDSSFMPPLSCRVGIGAYAQKMASMATRFEAWTGGTLIGLVAAYCNDQENGVGYITSVSVLPAWTGNGIAARLMRLCVEHAKACGMRQISLEVATVNANAIRLYQNSGFTAGETTDAAVIMHLSFESGTK